jgi:hypothetical protein
MRSGLRRPALAIVACRGTARSGRLHTPLIRWIHQGDGGLSVSLARRIVGQRLASGTHALAHATTWNGNYMAATASRLTDSRRYGSPHSMAQLSRGNASSMRRAMSA